MIYERDDLTPSSPKEENLAASNVKYIYICTYIMYIHIPPNRRYMYNGCPVSYQAVCATRESVI